jgi:hypothetical protein
MKRCPLIDAPSNQYLKAEHVAHELKELIKWEQRGRMYKKIGHTLQPDSHNIGSLSRVEIPATAQELYPQGADSKTKEPHAPQMIYWNYSNRKLFKYCKK